MKYLLSIYSDESQWAQATPQDLEQMMADYQAYTREVTAAGVMLGGEGLSSSGTSITVRVRDDEVLTSDGPFAETREQLGGYYLLDCATEEEAIGWAARMPGARYGAIEVRAVMDYEAVGGDAGVHSREVAR